MRSRTILIMSVGLLLGVNAWASYAIYVGKNLTADGTVMIGGSGDEVSSHWLEIVPAKDHPADATVTVGVTQDAFMPGHLSGIPQVRRTFRHLTMNYSEYRGLPPPLSRQREER